MHQEVRGIGAQWSNFFDPIAPEDPISMGTVLLLFVVNIVMYSALTWYLDTIKPGPFGVAQKWNFLCTPSYWRPPKDEASSATSDTEMVSKEYFETEPTNLVAGIAVNGLRKIFRGLSGSKVLAVDSVDFKAYKGEITALLGHNGAGKTTTMSMLTGDILL